MNLVDPLKQPQRFAQQADALLRSSVTRPDAADPGDAIGASMEASFDRVLADMLPHARESSAVGAAASLTNGTQGVGGPMLTGGVPAATPAPIASAAPVTGWPALAPVAGASGTHGQMSGLSPMIAEVSGQYDVPSWLVHNVIRAESGGNPHATSSVGAMGLMQLMPGTARELGVTDPYDPRQNMAGGTKYLGRLLAMFNGDVTKAVAAYNAGPASVQQYGGVPPFAETQAYVRRVLERS